MSINIFDTKHEITDLGNGIELHRFKNDAGEPYSAIYINSAEIYSCNRENENKMLDWFINGTHCTERIYPEVKEVKSIAHIIDDGNGDAVIEVLHK